jgi:hypothetical protein
MKKLLFSLIVINAIASLAYFYYILHSKIHLVSPQYVFSLNQARLRYLEFISNKEYLINNNLAQFSSYIIIDGKRETMYRIEALVQFNFKYIKDFGPKNNFKCVLKLVQYKNGNLSEEVLEIESTESPKFYWKLNKKLIFNLNPTQFKTYTSHFDLKKILVAIIWVNDYDSKLDKINFDLENVTFPVVLPYSFIKFQKPTIIKTLDQRLPSVSFCVHYSYAIPSQLTNWINYHLSFGVREIMIYDGMENNNLTKYLKSNYNNDDRITIIPYKISLTDLCNESVLLKQLENIQPLAKKLLLKLCNEFYEHEFLDRINWRGKHEQLTANDCYTVLKEKHEFIGYYDLDEFIYPRSFDNLEDFFKKSKIYSCDNLTRQAICNLEPLSFKNDYSKTDHLYNYLHSLIDKYSNGRDINKLGSISFLHAATIMPNNVEKKLIEDLRLVIETKNSSLFPIKVFLNEPPFINQGHLFSVEIEDIDYVKYLYKAYDSFIPCAYEGYLKQIDDKIIDKSLVRNIYYLTEANERMGKSIHYYKNVKSLFVHYAEEKSEDHWSFQPSVYHGHFMTHYRKTPKQKRQNFTGSIKKLNIDFEYVFFLLKNFTSFC